MTQHLGRSLAAAMLLAVGGLATIASAQETAKPKTKQAEEAKEVALKVGDKAPALQVEAFVKGDAVTSFEPGKVYVVEFWATWCGPCIKAFPHLSELQAAHKNDGVTFIGVNIGEDWRGTKYDENTLGRIREFVEKQGKKMSYTIAYDGGTKFMSENWFQAAGQKGIPSAMVVDKVGKVAWIGNPMNLDYVLPDVLAGKWDYVNGPKAAEAAAKEASLALRPFYAAMQSGDMKEALKEFYALKKNNAKAFSQVEDAEMTLLFDAGEEEKALTIARARVTQAIADEEAGPLNEIAWMIVDPEGSVKNKDLDLALKAASKAVEFEPKDGTILDTLARVYWVKGDKAKAIELQQKAVDMTKDNRMKSQLEATLNEYTGK